MKTVAVAVLAAALAIASAVYTYEHGRHQAATPIHVADVYAWDLDHADFGAACQFRDLHAYQLDTQERCDASFIVTAAQPLLAYIGGPPLPDYHVVPRSEHFLSPTKATVKVYMGNGRTAHHFTSTLVRRKDGWKVLG